MGSRSITFTPSSSGYRELLKVVITHNYYNDLICDDFVIKPTPHTANLIKRMDMLLIPFRGGIKLSYQGDFEQKFIDYVNLMWEEKHCPRLSFKFYLKNPLFINFTDLPIDLNPINECLYLSNSLSDELSTVNTNISNEGAVTFITPSILLKSERLTVYPSEIPVGVEDTENIYTAKLIDIVGNTAAWQDSTNQKNKEQLGKADNSSSNDGESINSKVTYPKVLYLDMKDEREGKYALRTFKGDVEINDYKKETGIYAGMSGTPFLFLDIILDCSDENNIKADVYPIVEKNKDEDCFVVRSQEFQINFKSRALYWDYYIVEPENHVKLYNPSIYGKNRLDKQNGESFDYAGRQPFEGKNTTAHLFKSKEKLELKEVSPYELSLEASRKGGAESADGASKSVIVKRLPVASINQINYRDGKSGKKDPENMCSNIYVYV